MPRFVIQEHFTTPHHFDVMLEREGVLKTWSVLEEPGFTGAGRYEAAELADHRLAYLTYEGEVGGGRGSVRIWCAGAYEVEEWSAGRVRIRARSARWAGGYELAAAGRCDAGGRPVWILSRPAAGSGPAAGVAGVAD